MKEFIIEKEFWDVFPNAKFGIVLCKGIDNTKSIEIELEALLNESAEASKKYLSEEPFSSNRVIKVWREAFQKFKTKKGVRSSIESLLKRVNSGNSVGHINPLVDIYNAVSLKYALPCGGEDINTIEGNMRLTKADGDELFLPLGADENMPPYKDEIIYKDDIGAICRCWNWRESKRTMLTDQTKDAFMCIELIDESREEFFKESINELQNLISRHLGGEITTYILDQNNQSLSIE